MKPLMYLASILVLSLMTQMAVSQAFCSLRDPYHAMQTIFPEATHHRSIVKKIDHNIREKVASILPAHTLHYGELGKHTLYIIYKDASPVGLIHVRSEASKWGLVEVAWALNINQEILDFSIQRCRCSNKDDVTNDKVKAFFKHKTATQLIKILKHNDQLAPEVLVNAANGEKELATVILRSATKTLIVTDEGWKEDIDALISAGI